MAKINQKSGLPFGAAQFCTKMSFFVGGIPQWNSGVLFVGDKGMLLSNYGKHVLLPEKQFEGFERPEQFIPKSRGHHAEWLASCKGGIPGGKTAAGCAH